MRRVTPFDKWFVLAMLHAEQSAHAPAPPPPPLAERPPLGHPSSARNVVAMQGTIQQDNARLASMDEDMAKGIENIARINVLTDEQRRKNRATTCLQCGAVLGVTLLFWGTFVLMRMFGKAPLLHPAAPPKFVPPVLTHPGKILLECAAPNPAIFYTLDGSEPSRQSVRFDAARPPV